MSERVVWPSADISIAEQAQEVLADADVQRWLLRYSRQYRPAAGIGPLWQLTEPHL